MSLKRERQQEIRIQYSLTRELENLKMRIEETQDINTQLLSQREGSAVQILIIIYFSCFCAP